MPRVLVIEKNPELQSKIEGRFSGRLSVESALTSTNALERHARNPFDVIVWDAPKDTTSSLELARRVQKVFKRSPKSQVILVSDLERPYEPVVSMARCQWLRSPYTTEELWSVLEVALHAAALPDGKSRDGVQPGTPVEFEGLLVVSLPMRSAIQQAMEAAVVDVPVLISGETGTGKDLLAAAIHKRSGRKDAPYLGVNMGAISPELIASELFGHERGAYTGAAEGRAGFFEQAQGGTLFLDEITTMDEKTQISLLRVLETKTIRRVRGDRDIKVNVRVIAATNESIEEAVKKGRFREDLYYRLDVFRIHLPPLRERHGGISLLTDYFVARYNDQYEKNIRVIPPETYRLLRRYSWPGNVRELKNVVQRAVLMAKAAELSPELLPTRIREAGGYNAEPGEMQTPIQVGMSLADVEREFMRMTLASVSGNKMKAASILGISRRALYNKLKRHGLL